MRGSQTNESEEREDRRPMKVRNAGEKCYDHRPTVVGLRGLQDDCMFKSLRIVRITCLYI
jgi:hypothetical protein